MRNVIISLIFIIFTMHASAEISLDPIHPDEPFEYTYHTRFSTKNALNSMSQIRLALDSFRKLTEASNGKVSKKVLEKIGHMDWETQNMGFMNWPGAVEGTIYKNEYIIKKLRYELVSEKVKSGQARKSDLDKAKKELQQSEQAFVAFWNSFTVGE